MKKYKILFERADDDRTIKLEDNDIPLSIIPHANPFGSVIEVFYLRPIKEENMK